jgi:hypothetical protein
MLYISFLILVRISNLLVYCKNISFLILIPYIGFLILIHLSNLISKLFQRVLMFNFDDMVSVYNEELLSLLNQILSGLLNGILSAFDKENHFEENDNDGDEPDGDDPDGDNPDGDDPHGPDPSGEDSNNSGPSGEGSKGSGPNRDEDNRDRNKNDIDMEDSDRTQKVDKGKQRAITPVSLPERPVTYEEPTGSGYDSEESFMKDIEQAKLNSLKEQMATGESSKQSEHNIIEEQDVKKIKDKYNKAVE